MFSAPYKDIPDIGTLYYYAYRKEDPKIIRTLYSLDQLKWQLIESCELYSDHSVGLTRLVWWKNQILNELPTPQLNQIKKHLDAKLVSHFLLADIDYAIQVLEGSFSRSLLLHTKQHLLGINFLKQQLLEGRTNNTVLPLLNQIQETCRHIIMLSQHYSVNLTFSSLISPAMNTQDYRKVCSSWLKDCLIIYKSIQKNLNRSMHVYTKIHFHAAHRTVQSLTSAFGQKLIFSPSTLLWYSYKRI